MELVRFKKVVWNCESEEKGVDEREDVRGRALTCFSFGLELRLLGFPRLPRPSSLDRFLACPRVRWAFSFRIRESFRRLSFDESRLTRR